MNYKIPDSKDFNDFKFIHLADSARPSKTKATEIRGITFVSIPSSSFSMGSTYDSTEQSIHTVKVSGFEMSIYEITQGQYQSVIGSNPSYF